MSGTGDPDVLRLLDAAANRAREGLRVVEDFARFRLDDAHLSALLKCLRHELAAALERLGSATFHRMRDTPGDVGTGIATEAEAARTSLEDVLRANCKRVEESLRTLEEYGKVIDPAPAGDIEQLRYRFYTIEQALLTTLGSRERLADCRLYLLISENVCRNGIGPTVLAALQGGVDAVQLREKTIADDDLMNLARTLREWTREAGALFIVNDRPDIAVLSDADGVHVGQDDLPVREARRIIGPDKLIGVSTHSIQQARQAVLDGADYLGIGPVFASGTKQFDHLAGLDYVREAAAEISLPWFPIGGITVENAGDVMTAGATRIAVSGAIGGAVDIAGAARRLRAVLARRGI